MHHGKDLHPVREHHVVNQIAELFQPGRPHVLPNQSVHFRLPLDTFEHLTQPGRELTPQAGL